MIIRKLISRGFVILVWFLQSGLQILKLFSSGLSLPYVCLTNPDERMVILSGLSLLYACLVRSGLTNKNKKSPASLTKAGLIQRILTLSYSIIVNFFTEDIPSALILYK